MRRLVLAAVLAALVPVSAARAATVTLDTVGTGFGTPLYVTSPPGDPDRLFVVEKTGLIAVVKDGTQLPTPFLDLHTQVSGDNEQGLLSLAFAPDYATSGRFYVMYTDTPAGNDQLVEYHRSAANPDVADPTTARTVLSVAEPEVNHNGGLALFGPDGHLYVGLGDGGGANDAGTGHSANGNGQDLSTLLGKILRIDPVASGGRPYTIPPGNPFATTAGAKPEIWAYGLRNPWRFTFDSANDDMWIGDVGQNEFEEVDHAPAGVGGQNYGWRECEGAHAFDPGNGGNPNPGPCTASGVTMPVLDYAHTNGRCAIVGGFVIHDPALGALDGDYIYGDECTGEMWTIRPPSATPTALPFTLAGLSSFGEDSCGHLYATSVTNGKVVRFDSPTTAVCPAPSAPGGGGGTPGGGGTTPPTLSVRLAGRPSRSGSVALRVTCGAGFTSRCTAELRIAHGRHLAAHSRTFSVGARTTRTVHAKLSARVRRSLRRGHGLVVRISVSAHDAQGDRASAARSSRLRR